MVFSAAREAIGPAPQANRFEISVGLFVPIVDWRAAQRLENLAPRFTCQSAQGHGRIGRAEGGGADIGDIGVKRPRQHGQPVDIGQFALVGGHAQGGVALGMFDRLVAFARGKLHVRDFHIVLIIQPHLGAQLIAGPLRHDPDGF